MYFFTFRGISELDNIINSIFTFRVGQGDERGKKEPLHDAEN